MKSTIQDIVKFGDDPIRVSLTSGEVLYSVIDFIAALTDTAHAKQYWTKLKNNEPVLKSLCARKKLAGPDGKYYMTEVATREVLLRIVQSIPSPKAEPIKQWLAGLGEEEQQRREDPEKGVKKDVEKFKLFMQAKGFSNDYISKRVESIIHRRNFTDAIKDLNLPFQPSYAKITTIVNKCVFDMYVSQHKMFKDVDTKQNLREHFVSHELQAISLAEGAMIQAIKKAGPTTDDALLDIISENGKVFNELVVPGLKVLFGVASIASPLSAKRDKNLLT